MSLEHSELLRLLHYDPETGIWTRLVDGYRFCYRKGDRADRASHGGYRRISIGVKKYYSHRLAVFYMTEKWPPAGVDHKNTDTTDNKWGNLRLANQGQNCANQRLKKNNTSGRKGVVWDDCRKKWRAQIHAGKARCLGRYATFEEAVAVREAAEKLYFGEFARAH